MAFLDNSGDIILDAVLTDTGRFRLAKGDGTFRIAKFAFGDDEINYGLYNKNHASGSAYFDLEVLQTPVLEAFTNNTSTMKSKLISIPRTNLLYLPVIKLYSGDDVHSSVSNVYGLGQPTSGINDLYVVTVDEATEGDPDGDPNDSTTYFQQISAADGTLQAAFATGKGVLAGFRPDDGPNRIEVHQGLDTSEIPPTFTIDADLRETQFIVEIDNRLGAIASTMTGETAAVSFVDDDNIASYFISSASPGPYVSSIDTGRQASTIAGPRGNSLSFKIKASIELATSTFLFTKLGSTMQDAGNNPRNFYFIDTTIRITGATTGYRLDVPVRFVKYKSS